MESVRDPVREAALAKANRVRTSRAQLKRDVKAGKRDAVKVLQRPPAAARGMKVYELLTSVPGVGESKANRLLVRARTSPNRSLGGLTDPQRAAIIDGLQNRGADDEYSG